MLILRRNALLNNLAGIPPEIRWNNQKNALQLWNKEGGVVRREGDPLEMAQ
ncbi:hypothetical protein [Shigella flexneri]|uniref:hypothetical protein n=1 Tax=Shigella flexneri TaxID=623 RepID=UPI0007780C01|nr:hypothetical protein [Shigella flexneri]AMN61088.1 integrase [Shigella flexneri 2a]